MSKPAEHYTTRLAPSPTGALHLGNARSFLVTWALARKLGWRIVLRIEDLDGPRIKPESAADIARTLAWLGMDWDGPTLMQSDDLAPYAAAMGHLAKQGFCYPSEVSRSELAAAASAPQAGSHEAIFPLSMRPADVGLPRVFDQPQINWRFATPTTSSDAPSRVAFTDLVAGPQAIDTASTIGDFIIWTKRGTPAYQLAVVVDDHRQGITHIVRGDDLLNSAARQLLLYRALGLGPEPVYAHLPLVVGLDGARLAKRHGDSRVETYRAGGVAAERIIGLCAWWSGLQPGCALPQPISAAELVRLIDLAVMPKHPAVLTPELEQWLSL